MFHAYQRTREASVSTFNGAQANLEVETRIARYRYNENSNRFRYKQGWGQSMKNNHFQETIEELSESFSSNGTLIDPGKSLDFHSPFLGTATMVKDLYRVNHGQTISINTNRSVGENTKNLANLSKGC